MKLINLIAFFGMIGLLTGQNLSDKDLFEVLKKQDSLLFSEGLNKCNADLMATLVTDDLEFYHDQGGASYSKEAFINQVKNGPCNKGVLENKRKLVEGSLKVYPLYNQGKLYAAIQTGTHQFGNSYPLFTHLWILENGNWKLSRVLSYAH